MKDNPEGAGVRSSINIESDVLKEMRVEKAHTGKELYTLVREAWGLYKQDQHGQRVSRKGQPALVGVRNDSDRDKNSLASAETSDNLRSVRDLAPDDQKIICEIAEILEENDEWLRSLVLRAIELRKNLVAGPPKKSATAAGPVSPTLKLKQAPSRG